jgi:hypothetical protein
MKRRKILATTTGVALTSVIAGCGGDSNTPNGSSDDDSSNDGGDESSNDDESGGSDPMETPTEEPTQTPTEEPEPAEFELVTYDHPSKVEIGEEFRLKISVKNVGGSIGDYAEPIYVRRVDGDGWEEGGEWDFEDVEPGEIREAESAEMLSFDYINTWELRLGDFDQTTEIEIVGAQKAWGEVFTDTEGFKMRADKPRLMDSYKAEDYDGSIIDVQPEDGGQWAIMNFWCSNKTGETNFSPLASDIVLLTGNSQFDGETILIEDPIELGEPFDGGELQPNVEREGWIAYQVPEGLTVEDLTCAWSDEGYYGTISVNWQSNP